MGMLVKKDFGYEAEDLAVVFLERKGLKILERNYRSPQGEIDIIAQEKDVVCFIEVRARSKGYRVHPIETIHPAKIRKIVQTARWYIARNNAMNSFFRFDVVAIVSDREEMKIDHIPDVISLQE
jgi:putative endonuclease